MVKRNYKVEGNIMYPDETMLTWGPFYYHSYDKGKARMETILSDITNWCNLQEPSLNIAPNNLIRTNDQSQIAFNIKAWKDENTLQECKGLITIEDIFFEDADEN